MTDWRDYWRDVCAPKLRARKEELGRSVTQQAIAAQVQARTGKPSKRVLVTRWLQGDREPFISQFLALCQKLEVDPLHVLQRQAGQARPMLRRVAEPTTSAYRVKKTRAQGKQGLRRKRT